MKGMAKLIFGATLGVIVLLFAVPQATAASKLDQYRAQGIIAERYDGLVELRASGAPTDARSLVNEVNTRRRDLYRKRAASQGVPMEEVGKIYASEILGRAPAGTYFKKPDGTYVRK